MPNNWQPEPLQGIREWCVEVCTQNMAKSTKHLPTSWLAGLKQEQPWLNLYLQCQQLNYYTAQRECVCERARSCAVTWMTHPPIMWLINHCSYNFCASSWIFPSPPFIILIFSCHFHFYLFYCCRHIIAAATYYVIHSVTMVVLSSVFCLLTPEVFCDIFAANQVHICQKAIKKNWTLIK